MSDVAKHAVGHGVFPGPIPIVPPLPPNSNDLKAIKLLGSDTVFDGDDFEPFSPSFDIEGAAARAVAAYDRNNDGAIDLNSKTLLGETTRFTDSGTSSIRDLAEYADRNGNNDGSATAEEIADVIRRFDQGNEGDGRLSDQERETFLEVFGEDENRLHKRVPTPFFPPRHLDHPTFPFDGRVKDKLLGDHAVPLAADDAAPA